MAKTPEKKVKDKIKAWLNTLADCWYFAPVASPMGAGGIPDLIVCLRGRFVGIEVKAPGRVTKATDLQLMQISRINAAEGLAFVTDSFEHCFAVLKVQGYV